MPMVKLCVLDEPSADVARTMIVCEHRPLSRSIAAAVRTIPSLPMEKRPPALLSSE